MKTININAGQEGVEFLLFPDNQPHVNIKNVERGEKIKVVCSIDNTLKLVHLLLVSSALDEIGASKEILYIPYLMGARFDRVMNDGDSFDLKVIAGLINGLSFNRVLLFDVHSDVSTALINKSTNINNKELVKEYNKWDSILICPDAGAAKKIPKYLEWNSYLTDVIYCNKERDTKNGSLKLKVLEPGKSNGKDCVIIDDLCDGGGTFIAIAEQLISPKSLTLIVSHGIFSKGFVTLEKWFDEIITSNSYRYSYNSNIIKVINVL